MASNGGFNSHASYNDHGIDVSDVLGEIKNPNSKRKHKFMDDDEMDFQTWTNGFLNDDSITNSNDEEIVVEYYNNPNGTTNNQNSNSVTNNNQNNINNTNIDNANNTNTSDTNNNETNANTSQNTHLQLSKKQKDDFILKCLTYEKSNNSNGGNDEDLAVQAVNQAVNQAVQAVQDEVDNINNDDSAEIAAAVAAVEEVVLNGLKVVGDKDNKRSDRQLFELIQNAINNDKLVKSGDSLAKSRVTKPIKGKPIRKQQNKVKVEANSDDKVEIKIENDNIEKLVESPIALSDETEGGKLHAAIVLSNSQIPVNMTQSPPSRSFTKEEKTAIDTFINKYQQIENITKTEFLDRIWSNERKRDKFWDNLQKVLPYRTRPSLYKHVRRTYHVFQKRGVWTSEEDDQLSELQGKYQGKWKIIGEEMKRMPEDCRDRWRNYIKCGQDRNTNKWSIEEEQALEEIVKSVEGTINWTKVSELMNGKRSRIQCRYKWNKIVKRVNKSA